MCADANAKTTDSADSLLSSVGKAKKYGSPPVDLGLIDLSPDEMLFWLYCPISTPGKSSVSIPNNLWQFVDIVDAARHSDLAAFEAGYVYLTAKTLWVSGDYIGNRPGWHSDGFGTDDINYIWYDRAPTEFIHGSFCLPTDCEGSMARMEEIAKVSKGATYPAKHLLRLDQTVIHRSPVNFPAGMRTFVKVSVSKDRYDLIGNSVNHDLPEQWPLVPRAETRNHPASATPYR